MLGSIGVTCRSKLAKIVPFGNLRWPPWQPTWKSIFCSISWPQSQLPPNKVGSIRVTYRSKIAEIVPNRYQRWPPWQPSWKSIFCFYSWIERPIDSKFATKHRDDLFKQLSWILLKMFVLMNSGSSSELGHLGSKTRSPGQISGKHCYHSSGHIFQAIIMNLAQNVCLDDF